MIWLFHFKHDNYYILTLYFYFLRAELQININDWKNKYES